MTAGLRAEIDLTGEKQPKIAFFDTSEPIPEWFRAYLTDRRRSLLMELGQIEDALGMERTVTPKRNRK